MDLLRVLTKRDPSPAAAAAGGEDADPPEAPSPQNRLLKLSQESGVGACRVGVGFFVCWVALVLLLALLSALLNGR